MKNLILTTVLLIATASATAGTTIPVTAEVERLIVKAITSVGAECPELIQLYKMPAGPNDAVRMKAYCGFEGTMYSKLVYEVAVKLGTAGITTVKRSSMSEQ